MQSTLIPLLFLAYLIASTSVWAADSQLAAEVRELEAKMIQLNKKISALEKTVATQGENQ